MEKAVCPDSFVGAAEKHLERPAFAVHYTVAGRFICVEADDVRASKLFRRYFAGWHVNPQAPIAGLRADATISVHTREKSPDPPHGLEPFDVSAGGVCHTDGQTYFFVSNDSSIRVRVENPTLVEVWIGCSAASLERAALARIVFNASMTAMRRCGLFELHAAGLVEPDTCGGVLFVGPSGSGKSTFATQLASAGWQYLSDDALLVSLGDQTVEARALRRVFAVTQPTVAAGVLAGHEDLLTEPVPFDPLKRRFEPERIFPGSFVERCVPQTLFFPNITGDDASDARRLTQAETMARLIRMCPWACYDKPAARTHLDVLSRLAQQTRAFELQAGRDLFGDANYTARFISRFAASL
jgi:hypothetical protein